jgi:hypothetical protein
MAIHTSSYPASDVLSVQVKDQGRAGVWFLNWDIGVKPLQERVGPAGSDAFKGPGLYALCFDDRLIYVGSYLGAGKGGAYLTGDVAVSRWWTHVGAITTRGSRVHIAPSSLKALASELGPSHPMVAGFLGAPHPEMLHKDQGDLSPLRRLRFAAAHGAVFFGRGAEPSKDLQRFTFVYTRFEKPPPGLGPRQWKERIEAAEQRLIEDYAPACNSKHVPAGRQPVEASCRQMGSLLEAALRGP